MLIPLIIGGLTQSYASFVCWNGRYVDNKSIAQVYYYKLSMPKIFISYRRADSQQVTGRIYDRLIQAFDSEDVFKDVDNIPPGKDFRGVLREATAQCDIMLVIIGLDWLTVTDDNGNRRLDDPEDFVRLEVETGLQRDSVTVIPVLVKGAKPPHASELPDSLKQLAYNNAFIIHNDPHFSGDVQRLISKIQPQENEANVSPKSGIDWRWLVGAVIVPLIAALIAISPSFFNNNDDSTQEAQVITEEASETPTTGESSQPPSQTASVEVSPTEEDVLPTNTVSITEIESANVTSALPDSEGACLAQIEGEEGSPGYFVDVTATTRSAAAEPVELGATVEIVDVSTLQGSPIYEIDYIPFEHDTPARGWIRGHHFVEVPDCASN